MRAARAEMLAAGQHRHQRSQQPAVGEEQVEKARARHLEALQVGAEMLLQGAPQALCDLARGLAQTRRQQQRGVRRVVAELRSAGSLQADRRARAAGALAGAREALRGEQHRCPQVLERRRPGPRWVPGGGLILAGCALGHGSGLGACDTSYVNDQDPGAERHINIHLSPEIMGGVYANFANVSHSDYEFTVTFARVDHEVESEEVPGVVVSRVNLSPRFMRELIDAMEDNYSKWLTREGIKNLPEYGGSESSSDQRESRTAARPMGASARAADAGRALAERPAERDAGSGVPTLQ